MKLHIEASLPAQRFQPVVPPPKIRVMLPWWRLRKHNDIHTRPWVWQKVNRGGDEQFIYGLMSAVLQTKWVVSSHWPWQWWPPGSWREGEWSASWPSLLTWWCSTTMETQSPAALPSDTVHRGALDPILPDCYTSQNRTWTEPLTQPSIPTMTHLLKKLCFLTESWDIRESWLLRRSSYLIKSWHPKLNLQVLRDSRQQGQTRCNQGEEPGPPQNTWLCVLGVAGTS